MTEFVTIKPAEGADGKPLRIPMPAGLGLPGSGSPLPTDGARVPATHFVQRLLADGDAVLVPNAPEPVPSGEHE